MGRIPKPAAIIFCATLLACGAFAAGRPFENSDFEKGTFTNWPVHENWSVVDGGSLECVPPEEMKIDIIGQWGACSIYRLGEMTIKRYSGTSSHGYPRKLVSAPFKITEPFLVFSAWASGEQPQGDALPRKFIAQIGLDTKGDGIPDIALDEGACRELLKGRHRFSLDTRAVMGKEARFTAIVASGLLSLDNILLEKSPSAFVKMGAIADKGGTGRLSLLLSNPNKSEAIVKGTVKISDYYGEKAGELPFEERMAPMSTSSNAFAWPVSDSPQYLITVDTVFPDGLPESQLFARHYTDEKMLGRKSLLINAEWEVSTSQDKKAEVPAPDAKWAKESPCRPSGTYGYRETGEWNKYQDTAQVWYKKNFDAPEWLGGERLFLDLPNGGTGLLAIFINGNKIAEQTMFYFNKNAYDLTPYLKTGGANELVLRFRNPKIFFKDANGQWTEPIIEYWGIPSGIYGNIYLEGRPDLNADQAFIDSYVADQRLDVRLRVKNYARAAREATVSAVVRDSSGKTVLKFKPCNVKVEAGAESTVKLSEKWANPILWTPDNPNLLRLQCKVESGKQCDDTSERFGFREFSIKGNLYLLNGYPVSISDALEKEPETMGAWKQWWGANAQRAPWISVAMADHGDEDGYLMRTVFEYYYLGGGLSKPPKSFTARHVKSFQNLQLKTVEYFYNHPCIYMWNLGNELDGHGYFQPDVRDFYTGVFEPIVEQVNRLDPQRPCTSSGEAIMPFWRKDVWCVHYPHEYGLAHDLPNEAHLIREHKPLHVLAMKLPYDGKPVFCGENFTESGVAPYLANIAGDKSLDFDGLFDAWKEYFQMRFRAYREDRITSSAPFSPIATVRNYYPIDVYPQSYREQFYSGEETERGIMLMNDTFSHRVFTLHYRLGDIAAGEVKVKCTPGERKIIPIKLKMPDTDKRLALKFKLWLTDEHDRPLIKWGSWEGEYAVSPKARIAARAAVWGRDEAIEKMLRFYGVDAQSVQDGEGLQGMKLIFLDGDKLKEALAAGLGEWVGQGGIAMVLAKAGDYDGLPIPLTAIDHKDTRAFGIAPNSPLMKGIGERDLFFWGDGDNRVCMADFATPQQANCKILAVNGDQEGLRFSPYLTVANGKGLYALTTLLLPERYESSPAVGILLKNICDYAGTPPALNPIKVAALVGDKEESFFEENGFAIDDLAAKEPSAISGYGLLVVDASCANPDINALAGFVANGGKLVLKRLTPDKLRQYAPLIGNRIALLPAQKQGNEAGVLVKLSTNPLLDGIGNYDLLWKRGQVMLIGSRPKDMRFITAQPADYVLDPKAAGDGLELLTQPAALALLQKGKGQIVIDQVRWGEAFEAEPTSKRVFGTLLANLGVPLNTGKNPAGIETVTENLKLPANYGSSGGILEDKDAAEFYKTKELKWKNLVFKFPEGKDKILLLGTGKNAAAYPKEAGVDAGVKADKLYFLQSSAFGYIDYSANKPVVEYTIEYADGQETVKGIYGQSLDDYRVKSSASLSTGEQATTAQDQGLSTYLMPWKNPRPDQAIQRIKIRSVDNAIVPLLFGIIAEKATAPGTAKGPERRRQGLWSVAAAAQDTNANGGRVWAIAGPFNFEPIEPITTLQPAFDKDFGPEQYMTLQQIFQTPLGDITWNKFVQSFPDKPTTGDFMDLNVILRFGPKANTDNYVSYLFTKVYTEKAQKVLIAFGSDDAGKIWLNGKLVHSIWALRGTKLGDDMVAASLEKGWNTVLVKHVNMRLGAGIAFDIKAYSADNVKAYNDDTSRARFAELPSLPLRYDAYALDNAAVSAIMMPGENSRGKALPEKLEGSGR